MIKKTIKSIVATTVIIGGFGLNSVNADSVNDGQIIIPVIVNGQKVKFPDTEPYVDENGRTLVPVRFVSETLGADVIWNNDTRTVTVKNNDKTISMTINSKVVTVNGTDSTLDTAAVLTDGRTMVPLRFVSETLNSKVTWDNSAHAVQISNVTYQAKIENGTVKLDAWGRELSKDVDTSWNKLLDMPSYVYTMPAPAQFSNKEFFAKNLAWTDKAHVDKWADRIRNYYQAQLNIDYRTIDEASFTEAIVSNMGLDKAATAQVRKGIISYVAWIKKNHVIAKGYADPENSLVRYMSGGPVFRTHFKFMIVKADDASQTFADNWNVSQWSDSFDLKVGVWYDGYSDVAMGTNFGNNQEEHFGLTSSENMFLKDRYKYEEVKE